MTRQENPVESYHEEQDQRNTLLLREVMDSLPQFCRQFFRGISENTSARTRLAYAYDLRVFFEYLHTVNSACAAQEIKDYPLSLLESLCKEDIEEYLEYLSYYEKDGKTITNDERGKMRKLSALKSLYRYFYTSERIEKDVAALVATPKLHEKPIIRLDAGEVATLLDQVEDGEGLTKTEQKYHAKTRVRDLAILTLLLGTGIRVSECVGLDLDDISFRDNAIKVHRKGDYDAIVYFGDEVEQALREYLGERTHAAVQSGHENALFLSMQNRRITVRAIENLVKKYASRVTTLKKITPHKLRSTYGTALYQETDDIYLVASVLGHKDVNTTRKHYADMDDYHRRKAANIVKLREKE